MTHSIFQTSKLFTISIFILTVLTLGSCSTSKQIGSVPNPTFKSYTEKSKHGFGKNQTKRDNRKQGKKTYVQSRNNETQIKSSKDTNNLQSSQAKLNQKKRIFTDIPILESLAMQTANVETINFSGLANTSNKTTTAFTDIQNATKNDGTVKPKKNKLGKKLQKKFERQLYKFVPELDLERVDTNDKSKTQSGESKGELDDETDSFAIIAAGLTVLTWVSILAIPFTFGLSAIFALLSSVAGSIVSIASLKNIVKNPYLQGKTIARLSLMLNLLPLALAIGLILFIVLLLLSAGPGSISG